MIRRSREIGRRHGQAHGDLRVARRTAGHAVVLAVPGLHRVRVLGDPGQRLPLPPGGRKDRRDGVVAGQDPPVHQLLVLNYHNFLTLKIVYYIWYIIEECEFVVNLKK